MTDTTMIFETLKSAFGLSTHNNNRFKKAIESIKWDNHYKADDEHYYEVGDMTFITPSLNPFECDAWRKPAAFINHSYIEF